jgi:glycosyltransferase involved in cell wall biosynthesis
VRKKKILFISDHPLSTSGVGCQARYLIEGLIKTGKYTFRCLGAAIKHNDYRTIKVNDDWIIKPIDGFGDKNMIRFLLATEKPDAIVLFTDPRFFMHIFEVEDEIHQVCPISWWHVWDNDPWPAYNKPIYDGVDLCNCHSHKTYGLVKEHFPEITNFIPHAVPKKLFFPIEHEEQLLKAKTQILGENKKDHFVGFWVNRNARRKMPGDVLDSWSIFLDKLEAKHGHRNATLLMHTDPMDKEGPNLFKITEHFGIQKNVAFSTDRVDFQQMNVLHNISDFYMNISCNEGFGLGTLEAMMCGKPIIALKTGGMIRQVEDHRDGSHNGIGLEPDVRDLVGSQMVPYICEDHVSHEKVANAILEVFDWGPEKRKEIGQKALSYAHHEFDLDRTVADWDKTLSETMENWGSRREKWVCERL